MYKPFKLEEIPKDRADPDCFTDKFIAVINSEWAFGYIIFGEDGGCFFGQGYWYEMEEVPISQITHYMLIPDCSNLK